MVDGVHEGGENLALPCHDGVIFGTSTCPSRNPPMSGAALGGASTVSGASTDSYSSVRARTVVPGA